MVTTQLLQYVSNKLKQGVDKAKIKNSLLSVGWQERDINQAFAEVENAKNSQAAPSLDKNNFDLSDYFKKKTGFYKNTDPGSREKSYTPGIIGLIIKYSGGMIKSEIQAMAAVAIIFSAIMGAGIYLAYIYYF